MKRRNKHLGSSLDDFLKEEGIFEETRAIAIREAVACQLRQPMEKDNITEMEDLLRLR
jgi:antitoxin HicB